MRGTYQTEIDAIHRLWRAVVTQAVQDALYYQKKMDDRPKEKRARRELKACEKAYHWIMDLHPDFIQICEVLGIAPLPIKKFILSDGALEIRNQFYSGRDLGGG